MRSYLITIGRAGAGALLLFSLGCQSMHGEKPSDAPVRVRWSRDPESLSPFGAPNQYAIDALNLLTPCLVLPEISTQRVAPYLVEKLAHVTRRGDSLTVLTYQLRAGAVWDNGQPVLATDVAFTYKLLSNPYLPINKERQLLSFLTDIELNPRDPRSFALICRGAAGMNYEMSAGDIAIMAEAGLDSTRELRAYSMQQLRQPSAEARAVQLRIATSFQRADLAHHPNNLPSCGPYRLAEWQPERSLRFTRSPTWWGTGLNSRDLRFAARPREIQYLIIPDETKAVRALEQGDLDVYPQLTAELFDKLRHTPSASSKLSFSLQPTYDVVFAGFNTRRPNLADAATRRALAHLFNPALLNGQSGEEWLTVGFISPADQQHYNDSLPLWPHSPRRAVQGLQAAGWRLGGTGWQRAGQRLSLVLSYRQGESVHEQVAKQFAEAAKEIGVPVSILPTQGTQMHWLLAHGEFDLYIKTSKGNPFGFDFKPVFSVASIGESNYTGFGNAKSELLLNQLATASDPRIQKRLLWKFQDMIREEMPVVPLFVPLNRVAANRLLSGLHVNSLKPGFTVGAIEWQGEE